MSDKLVRPKAKATAKGAFIVFEGGDGVGKTTQVNLLKSWLVAQGREVVTTFEPGDTRAGAVIRNLLLDPATGRLDPKAEALLYAADKAQHLFQVVLPALAHGRVVLCDRYLDSMLAYQGAGRRLNLADVTEMARWATGGVLPDVTVLLDMDPVEALKSISDKDRLEAAGIDFHQRVRQGFLDLAARDPHRYLVLRARAPKAENARQVRQRVAQVLSLPPGNKLP